VLGSGNNIFLAKEESDAPASKWLEEEP